MSGRPTLGPRRELLVLMPVALLVLALLAVFTLFAYRNAIDLMLEQRELETERLVRQIASELSDGTTLDLEPWRRRLPTGSLLVLEEPSGRRLAVGDLSLLEETGLGIEPSGRPETLRSTAFFERRGTTYNLHLDLPVPILRSRERGLEILVPVVVVVSGGITVLVLLFLRRFLAPLDRMVARARDAGQASGTQDEVDFLVDTFEKALEALARPPEVDDLKAIESTLVESLKSGVVLCDAQGRVLSTNAMARRLLGLDEAEAPGEGDPAPDTGHATVTAPSLTSVLAQHSGLVAAIAAAIENGEAVERKEVTITTAEGERLLGLTVHPIRRETGIRGFLAIFADLTTVRAQQEEERLVDNLSQLGELSAGVAHEMRNSLATLRGYLSLIERRPEGPAVPAHLGEIRHESDHLQRVLEDFLSFARPGSVRPQETDVTALVRRAACDPALEGAWVEVAATEEPRVLGDPQLLERAIRNLLHNAVEAHGSTRAAVSEGSNAEPVRVRVGVVGEGVEIRVEDRGPGLSDEARERLFDPFFSARPGGVGMGLALTRRIALLHAGKVVLEPRAEGGTRAVLWIPRVAAQREDDRPPSKT